jgi:hydroxypyruvate isomerase
MQPMFTRRTFVSMTAAALAARTLKGQDVAGEGQASTQFSVMIWTLKKLGTFEENLDRVAQAGFHHVELGG